MFSATILQHPKSLLFVSMICNLISLSVSFLFVGKFCRTLLMFMNHLYKHRFQGISIVLLSLPFHDFFLQSSEPCFLSISVLGDLMSCFRKNGSQFWNSIYIFLSCLFVFWNNSFLAFLMLTVICCTVMDQTISWKAPFLFPQHHSRFWRFFFACLGVQLAPRPIHMKRGFMDVFFVLHLARSRWCFCELHEVLCILNYAKLSVWCVVVLDSAQLLV